MSRTYRLAYVTPSRRVAALLPPRTSQVHVYLIAPDLTTATYRMSKALGLNIPERNVKASGDSVPTLLARSGLLDLTRSSTPTVLVHGPVGAAHDSMIIQVSQFDTRIIGHIQGRGRAVRLKGST